MKRWPMVALCSALAGCVGAPFYQAPWGGYPRPARDDPPIVVPDPTRYTTAPPADPAEPPEAHIGVDPNYDINKQYAFVQSIANTAVVCRNLEAAQILAPRDARERLGEINFMQIITRGDCTEINDRPRVLMSNGNGMMCIWVAGPADCFFVPAIQMTRTTVPKHFDLYGGWAADE